MSDPLWKPSQFGVARANLTAFRFRVCNKYGVDLPDYPSLYRWSVDNPVAFWSLVWDDGGVIAEHKGAYFLEDAHRMPGARWFPQARLNFAENLLRYRDDREALVFSSETGIKSTLTYRQLYRRVAGVASALRELGVEPGDRVAAYMPNLPETIIAMLATTTARVVALPTPSAPPVV